MKPTYQNRRTGEFFERVWINGSHVGLVSLYDGECVKVKRSNLVKSYKLADDYRHVPPAPDPPEPIGEPLPVRVGDKLPGPKVAPRPITPESHVTAPGVGGIFFGTGTTTVTAPFVLADPPPPQPGERFWNWPTIAAVVLAALFVVVMWIAVLS